jgi:hypothetical protein
MKLMQDQRKMTIMLLFTLIILTLCSCQSDLERIGIRFSAENFEMPPTAYENVVLFPPEFHANSTVANTFFVGFYNPTPNLTYWRMSIHNEMNYRCGGSMLESDLCYNSIAVLYNDTAFNLSPGEVVGWPIIFTPNSESLSIRENSKNYGFFVVFCSVSSPWEDCTDSNTIARKEFNVTVRKLSFPERMNSSLSYVGNVFMDNILYILLLWLVFMVLTIYFHLNPGDVDFTDQEVYLSHQKAFVRNIFLLLAALAILVALYLFKNHSLLL